MASNIKTGSQRSSEFVTRTFDLAPYTISMLVIGSSGTGKSMFCNFISQKEAHFAESCGIESVTDEVEHCVTEIGGEKVLIVDSPGFNDPIKSDVEIFEKISETAILTRDGVDVIAIMVDPSGRFTTEDWNPLKIIEKLGGNMWEHAFFIFNNASKIERSFRKSIEEYIKQMQISAKCPKELKELLKEVGYRYICVESDGKRDEGQYWQGKSKEVVEMIMRLRTQNNGTRYINEIMRMGLEGYKRIKRLERENNEKSKEIERLKKGKHQDVDEIQRGISMLQIGYRKNEAAEVSKIAIQMMEHMHKMQEMHYKSLESHRSGSSCSMM